MNLNANALRIFSKSINNQNSNVNQNNQSLNKPVKAVFEEMQHLNTCLSDSSKCAAKFDKNV